MIDVNVWQQHMGFLKVWFDTELSDIEEAFLLNYISKELTTEEFSFAAQQIAKNTPKKYKGYFPCVKDFIEASQGPQQGRAIALWGKLLKDVRAGKGYQFEKNSSRIIQDAIAAIGGVETVIDTPNSELKWLKKEFIEALIALKQLETKQNYLSGVSDRHKNLLSSDD